MKQIINAVSPFCSSGSKTAYTFGRVYDEELKREVVKKTGEFDIHEFIQASNSKTDLNLLRAQMRASGQIPQVNEQDTIDMTLFPKDIHELNNVVNSVDERFAQLPDNIKAAFGTKDKFLSALISGTFEKTVVNYYQDLAKSQILKDTDTKVSDVDKGV